MSATRRAVSCRGDRSNSVRAVPTVSGRPTTTRRRNASQVIFFSRRIRRPQAVHDSPSPLSPLSPFVLLPTTASVVAVLCADASPACFIVLQPYGHPFLSIFSLVAACFAAFALFVAACMLLSLIPHPVLQASSAARDDLSWVCALAGWLAGVGCHAILHYSVLFFIA